MESYKTKYLQKIKRIALCAGFLMAGHGVSTTAIAAGGTPAYDVETTSFQWIDASSPLTSSPLPIGFDFKFYGVTRNQLFVSPSGGTLNFDGNVPTANGTIAPLSSSLLTTTALSRVYMHADGAAPNRRLTISWLDFAYWRPFDGDCGYSCDYQTFGKVSFQVTLYEGSNEIVCRYLDVIATDEGFYDDVDNGKVAWVGVSGPGGVSGTVYSNNQAAVFNGTALRFFMGSNLSPIADAGADQVVNEGTNVTLNGGGSSDADGIAAFAWTHVYSPYRTIALETPNTATASFVAPQLTYSPSETQPFQLLVIDNKRAYTIDTTNVEILDRNAHPKVSASADLTVFSGNAVTLKAAASDPDGTIVRYIWYQTGGTSVAITGEKTAVIGFTAPVNDHVLTFRVTAYDNEGASASDDVTVTVLSPPIANAGADQTVKQKTSVWLDGSETRGSIGSYQWRQVSGKSVSLRYATSPGPTFIAPSTDKPINLTFELTVTDINGLKSTDQVVVTVTRR